jgi:hypothetical protein
VAPIEEEIMMFKLILSVGIISVIAACANMSGDSTSMRSSSRPGSSSMGGPAGTGDYGPNDLGPGGTVFRGGPN